MNITGFDHIVLSCNDVSAVVDFYRDVLGCRVGEERPGKWAIWFGSQEISLQDEANKPPKSWRRPASRSATHCDHRSWVV